MFSQGAPKGGVIFSQQDDELGFSKEPIWERHVSKKKKILIGVGSCCFATFVIFMILLLSGQGEVFFPSDVEEISLTVFTACISAYKLPPNFDKFNYLGTSDQLKGTLWSDYSGNKTPFGGSLFQNHEITNLIDLKEKIKTTKQSQSQEQSFYSIQNAIDVVSETGEVFYYDAQFMALNISSDTMTFLNSLNMGVVANKSEAAKWSDIEPLINGWARVTKFKAPSADTDLTQGQLQFLEEYEGLYVNGEPKGFGRWFTLIGDDAYRCELGYFDGRALHGKGKVYYKLKGQDVKTYEGLYSMKHPSWFYNTPKKSMTIASFEENEYLN